MDGSIVDQPLDCSIDWLSGNPLDGLVQIEGETAGQVAVGVGLGEQVVGPSLERGDRVGAGDLGAEVRRAAPSLARFAS